MKLSIHVRAREGDTIAEVGFEMPDMFIEAFDPLNSTDEPIGLVFGDSPSMGRAVERKVKLREDAAEKLAAEIAAYLVKIMKSRDRHNGYRIAT